MFTKEIEHTDFPLDEIKTVFSKRDCGKSAANLQLAKHHIGEKSLVFLSC